MSTYGFADPHESSFSGTHSPIQAIDATYYNITDARGWPMAALVVLIDSHGHPVRSELHLYDGNEESAHETAIRQARRLLQNSYWGDEPLELRILNTYQQRVTVSIELEGQKPAYNPLAGIPWWSVFTVAALAFVVVGFIWAVSAFFRSSEPTAPVEGAISETVEVSAPLPANNNTTDAQADTTGASSAEDISDQVIVTTSSLEPQTNGLSPSINANRELGIGQRIRINPGFTLALRSEPGPEAGVVVGYMESEQQATIIGGPTWTEGEADTIVWWYVRLDDNKEAWAAANTSEYTLLVPMR